MKTAISLSMYTYQVNPSIMLKSHLPNYRLRAESEANVSELQSERGEAQERLYVRMIDIG